MFLILNAIVASLDGIIIGLSLRLANIKIQKHNIIIIFIGNLLIYTLFLFLYKTLNLTFMTKNISTILYLFLAWHSFHEQETVSFKENSLKILDCIVVTITHSLDGTIISLNFAYQYHILYTSIIFSIVSLLFLLIGYYFAKLFKSKKKQNGYSAVLFILLAIINHFF